MSAPATDTVTGPLNQPLAGTVGPEIVATGSVRSMRTVNRSKLGWQPCVDELPATSRATTHSLLMPSGRGTSPVYAVGVLAPGVSV